MREKLLKHWMGMKKTAMREDGQEILKLLGVLAVGAILMAALIAAINAFAPEFGDTVVNFIREVLQSITG